MICYREQAVVATLKVIEVLLRDSYDGLLNSEMIVIEM